jgi:hypothetical protein
MPALSQNDIPKAAQIEEDNGHNREAAQTPSNASAERELGHCRSRCPSVAVVLVTVSLTFMQC